MVLAAVAVLAVVMDIGINLLVVDTAGVIDMTLPPEAVVACLPFLLQTHRGGDTLVVLQRVGGIGFGVQVIQPEVQYRLFVVPADTFAEEKQFAESVGFESCTPRRRTAGALYLDDTRGDIAILGAGYTADDLHFVDVVGRDSAHIYACAYTIALGVSAADV